MTTTGIQIPNINISELQAGLAGIAKALPAVVMFFPQAAPILAFVPLLQEGLAIAGDIQAKWGDPSAVIDSLATHLNNIAQQVRAAKPHVVAAAAATPAGAAINFQASTGAS